MTASPASIVVCPNCGRRNRAANAARGTPHCRNCHQPLPWIVESTDDDFGAVADDATLPVLVDLWAPWCGPCRMVSPALENLAREYAGRVKIVKVNVDASPATARRFRAQGIPMLIVLRDGRVLAEHVGAAGEQVLRTWLDGAITGVSA